MSIEARLAQRREPKRVSFIAAQALRSWAVALPDSPEYAQERDRLLAQASDPLPAYTPPPEMF